MTVSSSILNSGLKSHLQVQSRALGFDAIGFCSPFLTENDLFSYRRMVTKGDYGDMAYLARHLPFKENPNLLLPGVKTAIVVIKSYKNTSEKHLQGNKKIARYAVGKDYHIVITEKLRQLEAALLASVPEARCHIGVDSNPIAERSLAIKSGIGFRGRNSMIIRHKLGSYFFIGVLLTTIDIAADPMATGTCGTCQRCIDACPTQALGINGEFHMTKCIAYTTIEKKLPTGDPRDESPLENVFSGAAPPTLRQQTNGWAFGCDVCQEVCPFNNPFIPETDWPEFHPEAGVGFHFLETATTPSDIPKTSPLYRSRKRLF